MRIEPFWRARVVSFFHSRDGPPFILQALLGLVRTSPFVIYLISQFSTKVIAKDSNALVPQLRSEGMRCHS